MIANTGGLSTPAIAPCAIRQATNAPGLPAAPHNAEVAVNPNRPMISSRR